MILADYQAVNEALRGIRASREAREEQEAKREQEQIRLALLKHQLEQEEIERAARMKVAERHITLAENEAEARKHEAKAKVEADAIRNFGQNWEKFGDFVRRESDPVTQLQRTKAQRELAAIQTLPPAADDAQLATDVNRAELKKRLSDLEAPPTAPGAKVVQTFGAGDKSRVEFAAPLDEAKKLASSSAYHSPYATDIADLGSKIAQHQAEIEGGDKRTGFLNITSRQDLIDQAKRQQRRLQAMELQDMLSKGVIDQAEADRRANLILATK